MRAMLRRLLLLLAAASLALARGEGATTTPPPPPRTTEASLKPSGVPEHFKLSKHLRASEQAPACKSPVYCVSAVASRARDVWSERNLKSQNASVQSSLKLVQFESLTNF